MELSGNLGLDKSARGSIGGIYIPKEKRSTFQSLLLRRIQPRKDLPCCATHKVKSKSRAMMLDNHAARILFLARRCETFRLASMMSARISD